MQFFNFLNWSILSNRCKGVFVIFIRKKEMLRSAVAAVKNAAIHPEKCRQLNPVQLSRLMGLQFRCYTAQTTPDSNSSEQTTNQQDQQASDPQRKADEPAKESKEREHDRLLTEKEELLKDLQVCYMRCDIWYGFANIRACYIIKTFKAWIGKIKLTFHFRSYYGILRAKDVTLW